MQHNRLSTIGIGLLVLTACDAGDGGAAATASSATAATATATAQAAKSAAEPAVEPVPSNVPDAVEGANITMGSIEADGLTAKKLSCKSGGGMFASMAILGVLSKQKAAFDKCVKGKASVRVHFGFEGKDTRDVRVADASDAKVARCVADVLKAAQIGDTGACVMTLELGPQ